MFGFHNLNDFVKSLAKIDMVSVYTKLSIAGAAMLAFFDTNFGLGGSVFIAFLGANLLEWWTGIAASKAEGIPIQSEKLHRFLIKTVVYVSVLGVIFSFEQHFKNTPLRVVWSGLHYFVLSYITLILIRSIFENLHRMGVKEAKKIYMILDNKITRSIAFIASEPDATKKERHAKRNSKVRDSVDNPGDKDHG